MVRYRLMDHTADLGVYFYGRTPAEVFIHAGAVLFELMVHGRTRSGSTREAIVLEGLDREDLLVRWLAELLYIYAYRERVMTAVNMNALTSKRLEAEIELVVFDPVRMSRRTEIKAVTYHQIEFRRYQGRWRARVVFDL